MKFSALLLAIVLSSTAWAHADPPAKPEPHSHAGELQNQAADTLLLQARSSIDARDDAGAIAACDKIIKLYESKYSDSSKRWFIARTSEETLAYLLIAAADADKGVDKRNAVALTSTEWGEALYLKGYALVELGRLEEARDAYDQAIKLAPFDSKFLSELGSLYLTQKNWSKAMELFDKAKDAAAFSPLDSKTQDATRAGRGLGYVLVELGRLDEAATKYEECLKLDPNDARSQRELAYVRSLQASKSGSTPPESSPAAKTPPATADQSTRVPRP